MEKSFLFCTIVLTVGFNLVACTELPEHVKDRFKDAVLPQSLSFIGTVEGKSYFADNTTYVTWFQAKEYCESMRMKLALIETPAQATLLNNSYNEEYFTQVYWISGRDSLTPQQFSWDSNNNAINDSFLPAFRFLDGIQSCLMYNSESASTSEIFVYGCDRSFSNVGTLCEV